MAREDAGTLLEPLIPALRRYAYALVRDHDAADDLVQDTLERALSRWYLRRSEAGLRAWLFTILRNLFISAYRQRSRQGPDVAMRPGWRFSTFSPGSITFQRSRSPFSC